MGSECRMWARGRRQLGEEEFARRMVEGGE